MAGGRTQSSSSSGIFFQGDGESQGFINSHLTSSYGNGNSTNSGPGSLPGYHNLSMVSGELHNPAMISVSTSGPSAGASSLATDANSGLSGGPQLQRSASISINNESYRLPASPMSFSSNNNNNNVSISGSSVVDGSTVIRQNTQHDPSAQQAGGGGGGGSSATSLLTSQNGQIPFSATHRAPESSFFQDPNNLTQVRKKPRIDTKQDDMLQQQILRQWLQRQDMLQQQQQGQNPQFQLLLQQQKLRQHQQFMQSLPPLQRAQLQQQQQQQQQQLQMRQQLQQQQGMQQQLIGSTRPFENSVCARRLMQYLYHQRQRPSDNSIVYWRKFVAEYFSPRAKRRWCLSLYDNEGHHALGAFPQAAMDAWQCDICSSKSGRGFEATYDVLPRLNEIQFASGVLDELLYLGVPCERRFASGIMMLEYSKAIEESVYEHTRVVREGHLRIIFSQELKILSWEFCTRRHEELLPRRLVAPHVNQLLQVAQKCQSTISESGSDGVPQQDLQANSNMVMAAGRQLAKSLESHSLNDFGFSKRYVRCLQISEVVSSMKDLIDICHNQKAGPIEALKKYQCHTITRSGKLQMQEIEQVAIARGLPTDRNSLSKLMASSNTGINIPMNGNNQMSGQGTLANAGSAQASFALTNYQTMLMKQSHMSSSPNSNSNSKILQEPSLSSSSFVKTNSCPSPSYQGPTSLLPGSIHSPSLSGISSHLSPQRQVGSSSNSSPQPYNHQSSSYSYSSNQALEQHMIHQLWQQMSNSGQQQQQSLSGDQMSFSVVNTGRSRTPYGQNMATPRSSNSFKGMSNKNKSSSAADRDSQSVVHSHCEEVMIPNTSHDMSDNHGFFSSEVEDDSISMGYNSNNIWNL